jgi:hypothetical protein
VLQAGRIRFLRILCMYSTQVRMHHQSKQTWPGLTCRETYSYYIPGNTSQTGSSCLSVVHVVRDSISTTDPFPNRPLTHPITPRKTLSVSAPLPLFDHTIAQHIYLGYSLILSGVCTFIAHKALDLQCATQLCSSCNPAVRLQGWCRGTSLGRMERGSVFNAC